MSNLLFATSNRNKVQELQRLCKGISLEAYPCKLLEIQSLDPVEIAEFKVKQAIKQMPPSLKAGGILVDDTALVFHHWGRLPGPFIKWYLKEFSLFDLVESLPKNARQATAIAVLSLGVLPEGTIHSFVGEVKGTLVPPRGDNGFGWDSIFQPQGSLDTYASIDGEEKNKHSHRSLAFQKLQGWLQENEIKTP